MLELIQQAQPATHPYGDFFYGDDSIKSLFRFLTEDEYKVLMADTEYNPVPFSYFGDTARDILLKSEIFGNAGAKLLSDIQYTDFVTLPDGTDRKSLAMTPRIWLTKGGETFAKAIEKVANWRKEAILDADWNRSHMVSKEYNDLKPFNMEKIMLGSGIPSGLFPEHGSQSVVPVAMDTKQGDVLIFMANCWHNK